MPEMGYGLWGSDRPFIRRSAKTRSWEKAEESKRELEVQYQSKQNGDREAVAVTSEKVSVKDTVMRFLKSKRNENLADSTIDKLKTIFEKQTRIHECLGKLQLLQHRPQPQKCPKTRMGIVPGVNELQFAVCVLDITPYFCNCRNMVTAQTKKSAEHITRYADMFSAMGTEARLRIMQLLLAAHPEGMVVGEIQEELDIPNSTLSHHLDKLRNEGLVEVKRESTFLRYTANTEALQEILQFLYAECCTRNKALKPQDIVQLCK